MGLFGKSKSEGGAPTAATAIKNMKETLVMLEKKEAHLDKKMAKEVESAKEHMQKGNKPAALTCLKRKKLLAGQQAKLAEQRINMETQCIVLENASSQGEIAKSMKMAAAAMKAINAKMKPEDIEKVKLDMEDQMALAEEVSDILAQPFMIPGLEADEDELAAELDALMGDEEVAAPAAPVKKRSSASRKRSSSKGKNAAAVNAALADLPAAPTAKPRKAKSEEDELAALAADLAM